MPALLSIAAVAATATGGPAPGWNIHLLDPVPRACEAIRESLQILTTDPSYRLTADIMTADCRELVDRGGWPELTRALSATSEQNLQVALCTLSPPDAAPVVKKWLLAREPARFENDCLIRLLRHDADAFEKVLSARLDPPTREAYGTGVVHFVALAQQLEPRERALLLPVLEQATRDADPDRDPLYASLCATEPARSARACADFPRELPPKRSNTIWLHVGLATAYALSVVILQRESGRKPLGWPVAAPGTIAVFVAMCLGSLLGRPGEGSLAFLEVFEAFVWVPVSVVAAILVTWLAVGRARLSPVVWTVVMTVLYVLINAD